ncbi:MAG: MarR family transcriptional regulator [Acidimicrobiales bacterium]
MRALVSLAVAGPATVSELAARLDMSTAHASRVVGELASRRARRA